MSYGYFPLVEELLYLFFLTYLVLIVLLTVPQWWNWNLPLPVGSQFGMIYVFPFRYLYHLIKPRLLNLEGGSLRMVYFPVPVGVVTFFFSSSASCSFPCSPSWSSSPS